MKRVRPRSRDLIVPRLSYVPPPNAGEPCPERARSSAHIPSLGTLRGRRGWTPYESALFRPDGRGVGNCPLWPKATRC